MAGGGGARILVATATRCFAIAPNDGVNRTAASELKPDNAKFIVHGALHFFFFSTICWFANFSFAFKDLVAFLLFNYRETFLFFFFLKLIKCLSLLYKAKRIKIKTAESPSIIYRLHFHINFIDKIKK